MKSYITVLELGYQTFFCLAFCCSWPTLDLQLGHQFTHYLSPPPTMFTKTLQTFKTWLQHHFLLSVFSCWLIIFSTFSITSLHCIPLSLLKFPPHINVFILCLKCYVKEDESHHAIKSSKKRALTSKMCTVSSVSKCIPQKAWLCTF